jgi:hypothetical protein
VLTLPTGSRITRGATGDRLVGPLRLVTKRSQELGGGTCRPTFDMYIRVHRAAVPVSLATWVDSSRRADNALASEDAQMDTAVKDSIGSQSALKLEPYCGDCESIALFAARGRNVVEVRYQFGIHLAGTDKQQNEAHRAVLATFRWIP